MKTLLVVPIMFCGAVGAWLIFTGEVKEGLIFLGGTLITLIITVLFGYPQYRAAKEAHIPIANFHLEPLDDDVCRFEVVIQNQCNENIQVTLDYKVSIGSVQFPHLPFSPINILASQVHRGPLYEEKVYKEILSHRLKQVQGPVGDPESNLPLRLDITVNCIGLRTRMKGRSIHKEYSYHIQNEEGRLVELS